MPQPRKRERRAALLSLEESRIWEPLLSMDSSKTVLKSPQTRVGGNEIEKGISIRVPVGGIDASDPKRHITNQEFKFKFIYSHLFNYDLTKMRDRKEVKNRTDYALSQT